MKGPATMTIKNMDKFFLSLERQPKNNCKYTLMYARQGNAGNNFPFIVFLGHENINIPNIELLQANNIYIVMEYIQRYLKAHPNIGYFYA
jgi:hypothetical protein